MWHRRIYYHLAVYAHRTGPTAGRPRFGGRDRESLGTTAFVRCHPAVGLGIARPLIVLPSALVTGWSPEQVELALLHELAHVGRWDNLVNPLQRVVESALFFPHGLLGAIQLGPAGARVLLRPDRRATQRAGARLRRRAVPAGRRHHRAGRAGVVHG
jgi:hypothetical protein